MGPFVGAVLIGCRPPSDPADPPVPEPSSTGPEDTGDSGPSAEPPWVDFWGDAPPRATRLALFDELWDSYRGQYANFGMADEDWDTIGDRVRPLVAAEESYGGWYRHLSHLFAGVREGHSTFSSALVCGTPLDQRPPLFWSADLGLTSNPQPLGVCVTATPSETGLVVAVDPANPAGLEPGDELLGYDGVLWPDLLDEALDLPFCGSHAAIQASERHFLVRAVAQNPHLYQELDVRRHATGLVESIPTEGLLGGAFPDLLCSEVVPQGVAPPWSTQADWYAYVPPVSHGILPGTNIGYIYVYGWIDDAEARFSEAIAATWETDGLMVDFRMNIGGNMFFAYPALERLFDTDMTEFAIGARSSPDDLTALDVITEYYVVHADPSTFYDRPIAVLTGPSAISSGDVVAFVLAQHPRARRFGLPTNGSFCFAGAADVVWEPDPTLGDLTLYRSSCVGVGPSGDLLALSRVQPEEPVWLTPEDVAAGRDTVVDAARAWIEAE